MPACVTLTESGSVTSSADGQVIDALDIQGTLTINHDDVTVPRTRIRGAGFHIVNVAEGVTGARLEDCEIDGQDSGAEVRGSLSMARCNVHRVSGVVPGDDGDYRDNWIHDITAPGDTHTECFRLQGGQDRNRIVHNTLDMTNSTTGTAVVFINAYITDNVFDLNRMIGGDEVGYIVYSTSNTPDGCADTDECITTGTQLTNNFMAEGMYGFVYPTGAPSTTTIEVVANNRDSACDPIPLDFVVMQ